jgi:hypothetical protein
MHIVILSPSGSAEQNPYIIGVAIFPLAGPSILGAVGGSFAEAVIAKMVVIKIAQKNIVVIFVFIFLFSTYFEFINIC